MVLVKATKTKIRDKNPNSQFLFLTRLSTDAKTRYWPTELEIANMVWVVKKNPIYDKSVGTQNDHLHGIFCGRFYCTPNQFQYYIGRKIEFPPGESI